MPKKGKFVICDLCSKKIGFKIDEVLLWVENEKIDHDDMTIILLEKAQNYPQIKRMIVAICPNCFENKLIPWLKSQGVKIRE